MTKYSLEDRIKIYSKPLEDQFVKVFQQGDAVVLRHLIRSDLTSDYIRVLDVAQALALEKQGHVYILPEINAQEREFRKRLGLSTENGKTPDIMLEIGSFIDVKSPMVERKLSKNAGKAFRQSAVVCITDHRMQMDMNKVNQYQNRIFGNENYKYSVLYFYINGILSKRTKEKP